MNKKVLYFLLLLGLYSCGKQAPAIDFTKLDEKAKRLPENAVAGMQVANGCEVSLFASEPMLINPTNIHVDEKGRVWVCEALNYRNTHNPENPKRDKGDQILILEDTDQDGKADKKTVFYQGKDVDAALGIWSVGNRAIVSCSPRVLILTDTNGDNVADTKDSLFTGLDGYQSDHAVHAFVVGPDGKFYFNFGNNGKHIMDHNGKPVIDLSGNAVTDEGKPYRQGMVFRCNPDGSDLEVLGHNFRNNFEVAPDSYGALWQSDNDDDGNMGVRINYIMDYGNYGYTDEITGAGWGEPRVNQEKEIPKRHWRQNDPGSIPNLLQTGSGSPCGMAVYEGDMLPVIFHGQPIHAEAGHNVVRAYVKSPKGAGYEAKMVDVAKSLDQWSRPSDVCVAPDGSLFFSDWYDPAVGGHKFGDVERGRIFRVTAKGKGGKYAPEKPDFSNTEACIAALSSPNLSIRAIAAEKLRAEGSKATAALKKVWNGSDSRARARALWILGGLPGGDQYLKSALADKDPEIAITAIRQVRQGDSSQLLTYLKMAAKHPSPQVWREAAIGLRFQKGPAADQLWTELAQKYAGEDRWMLEALGIGADLQADARFKAWKDQVGDQWKSKGGKEIVWRSRSRLALPLLKELILDPKVEPFALRQYFRAFDFHADPNKNEIIASLVDQAHPMKDSLNNYAVYQIDPSYLGKTPAIKAALGGILTKLKGSAEYLELINRLKLKDQNPQLLDMALNNPDQALRSSAAGVLASNGGLGLLVGALKGTDAAKTEQILYAVANVEDPKLFALFKTYLNDSKQTLAVRRAALNCLNSSWGGQEFLMDLVEKNKIPQEFVMQALVGLSGVWNTDIRQKSRALLAVEQKKAGNSLPPVAILEHKSGNLASGKAIYLQHCATCHKVGKEGVDFGPALTEIGAKLDKGALYRSIIYPSSGINYGYEGFNVQTKDGSIIQGILASKTGAELKVRIMGGSVRSLPMADVVKMEELGQSLMTEGLYRQIKEQELVDLVEYLSSLKPAEKLISSR
jgi:putative membrane-bound dehydrogenase-like protein